MAFSDFDLKTACERFELSLEEGRDLYSTSSSFEVPPPLREILKEWAPAAVAMNTEKARSEMIIAPVLMTAARLAKPPVNLFSGIAFNVDEQRGLTGACDYLMTRSTERFFIRHPVAAIVEAKREDIAGGLGQCVAEMVAARIYNEREGSPNLTIHGVVTTGSIWRFLRLDDKLVTIDRPEYYLAQIGQILAILVSLLEDNV